MSDKTLPFVEKTIAYSASSPQFVPHYMNLAALTADHQTYDQLIPLFRVVKQLSNGLDDTTMQAGAACYTNALSYYNSVKQAACIDVPGGKSHRRRFRQTICKSQSRNRRSYGGGLNALILFRGERRMH